MNAEKVVSTGYLRTFWTETEIAWLKWKLPIQSQPALTENSYSSLHQYISLICGARSIPACTGP